MPHYEQISGFPTVTTTTETVVQNIPGLAIVNVVAGISGGNQPVPTLITGVVNVTPGTSTTAVQVRIRQGSLTGAIVGVVQADDVTAGVAVEINIEAYDSVGSATGWVLTVQQVGAAANATMNLVSVDANTQ